MYSKLDTYLKSVANLVGDKSGYRIIEVTDKHGNKHSTRHAVSRPAKFVVIATYPAHLGIYRPGQKQSEREKIPAKRRIVGVYADIATMNKVVNHQLKQFAITDIEVIRLES